MDRREFIKKMGLAVAATTIVAKGTSLLTSCSNNGDESENSEHKYGEMTQRTNLDGEKVSLLGYGCMRLPTIKGEDENDVTIDQEMVQMEIDYAMAHGITYYDTSPAYCKGKSENAIGTALAKHPRDKFNIATKLSNFNPATWSEDESKKMYYNSFKQLKVEHIDYYLLHSINDIDGFNNRFVNNGMLEFLLKERKAGHIRHLGFSFHGDAKTFDYLMAMNNEIHWDFVQIQMNFVDWNHAKEINKRNTNAQYLYTELEKRNIPVVVMEPLLGGRLASINQKANAILKEIEPNRSVASWAFRFVGSHKRILTVLSGMTYMENLKDNLYTFSPLKELNEQEYELLETIATHYAKYPIIPCTDCKYCMPCPYGLDIPTIFKHYNKCLDEGNITNDIRDESYRKARRAFLTSYDKALPKERQADHCISCGECAKHCPQKIKIPAEINKIYKYVEDLKLNGFTPRGRR